MTADLSFHPLARLELLDAVDFYEAEEPGLGRAFLAAIEGGLERIQQNPESAPIVRGKVRSLHLRRFPTPSSTGRLPTRSGSWPS